MMSFSADGLWLDLDMIERVMKDCQQIYPVTRYASISTPSYTTGQIGFVIASKNKVTRTYRIARFIAGDYFW